MKQLLKNIEKDWQRGRVKFEAKNNKIGWIKTLRTVDCALCGKHVKETKMDEGFTGWGMMMYKPDEQGHVPEICPECLEKIHGDSIPSPRFAECSKCKVRQREKIYGIGFPGWESMIQDGRRQPQEIIRNFFCPNCTIEMAESLGEKFIRGSWTDLTYAASSLLTSTKMTQNQANIEEAARHEKQALTVVWVSATTVDIDATLLCMDELSEPLTSVNLTVDISTGTGINTLDAGAEAANTWYSIWVIFKPATNTIAGLVSAHATAPTMPAGYTKKRRVGWVRNDAGSNFLKFYQTGNWWHYDIHHNVLQTGAAANAWADVDCSSFIPSTSQLAIFSVHSQDDNGEATTTFLRRNGSSEDNTNKHEMSSIAGGGSSATISVLGVILSCDSSQVIEYQNSAGDEDCQINVLGYYDLV